MGKMREKLGRGCDSEPVGGSDMLDAFNFRIEGEEEQRKRERARLV